MVGYCVGALFAFRNIRKFTLFSAQRKKLSAEQLKIWYSVTDIFLSKQELEAHLTLVVPKTTFRLRQGFNCLANL